MKNPYELAKNILQSVNKEDIQKSRTGTFTSINLYGTSVHEKAGREKDYDRFHLENETGIGDISRYHVFPGIELVYNDMHMAYCNKEQRAPSDVMEINYCKEGRSECLFGEHQYCYMSAGDLSFCSLQDQAHQSEFPTAHYHGITITIDFSTVTDEMRKVLELLSVDLKRIKELSRMREFTIIRANETVEHIFSELYKVPEQIRYGYIRVKVLELLLVMTGLDLREEKEERVHFSKAQIDVIKAIHEFLVEHYDEHYTIQELSERFEMSQTVMKKCFKGVYDDSIYAYMKKYRLQVAERLLKESSLTIGEIAAQIGYLNPNKFSSAFSDEYGISPKSYRKNISLTQMDRKKTVQ